MLCVPLIGGNNNIQHNNPYHRPLLNRVISNEIYETMYFFTPQYPYHLQKYAGIKTRHTCPNCGHKHEFTLYVDDHNRPIDPTCGKCNRESKCHYHLTPREFFRQHPERKAELAAFHRSQEAPPRPEPAKPVSYLPLDVLQDPAQGCKLNNLYRYLCTLFPRTDVDAVFRLYRVFTSRHWKLDDGLTTVFPQIDEQGRLRQLKLMLYNPHTGHRVKSAEGVERWSAYYDEYQPSEGTSFIYFKGRDFLKDKSLRLVQTFFGCHLLPRSTKPIVVVESEKTALVCTLCLPQYTWIATGGCNGVKWREPETWTPLKGREVTLVPDTGMEQEWNKRISTLRNYGVMTTIKPLPSGLANNTDPADLLLAAQAQRKKNEEIRKNLLPEVPKGDSPD